MNIRSSHSAKSTPRARGHAPQAAQPSSVASQAGVLAGPEIRHDIVAQAAYFRAQRRGFEPGQELDDWLAAEAEVDAMLAVGLPAATD
jgi:hypothetical protein